MEEKKQFVQLPNNMEDLNLSPKDQLIYLSIRRFMNQKTKIAFPSLTTISKVSGASINTIRKSISLLEDNEYIKVIKKQRGQEYHFNELKAFEPFSYDFLDKEDLTFTEKAYLVASQQYMFKDSDEMGKVSYTNKELSEKIHMSESTVSRTNQSLIKKNYLTVIEGTKVFDLAALGQAIVFALKNHEERLNDQDKRISKLEEENRKKDELIEKLLKDRFIMD